MPTIRFTIKVDGVPADATYCALSDPTGAYGARRSDTLAVVVADATAMTRVSAGIYEHTFSDPALDLTYGYYVEYTLAGATYYSEGEIAGASASGALTLAEMKASVAAVLEDTDNTIFSDDAVAQQFAKALATASRYVPAESKESLTFSAGSTELDAGGIAGLRRVLKAEYRVGQTPRQYRNVTQFGSTVTVNTTLSPAAGDAVYLYCLKNHVLTDEASSLSAELEPVVADLAAAYCAINWVGEGRTQIESAITRFNDYTAIYGSGNTGITGNIARAISDIGAVRTVLASETGPLVSMGTAITEADAKIGSALKLITDGANNAALKYTDAMTTDMLEAVGGTDTVRTIIGRAISDTDEARAALVNDTADFADEVAAIEDSLANATARLGEGSGTGGLGLINTITMGASPVTDYANYAGGELGVARGRINQINELISLARRDMQYLTTAREELHAANERLALARTYSIEGQSAQQYLSACSQELQMAQVKLGVARSYHEKIQATAQYFNVAAREMQLAQTSLSELGGFAREINSRLSVSNVIASYQRWGEAKLSRALAELRALQKPQASASYPEA